LLAYADKDFFMGEFNMNLEVTVEIDPRWRQLEDKYAKAVEIAARHVEAKAKNNISTDPGRAVDTGATMNSINANPAEATGLFGTVMAWRVGPTTEYAPFIEFGTVYMKERPFLIPALESESPKLIEAIKQLNDQLSGGAGGAFRIA